MALRELKIMVPSEVESAFSQAPDEVRNTALRIFASSLRLRDSADRGRELSDIRTRMSKEAIAKGLTEEVLGHLLESN
jgi:hypothetical protein